MANYCNLTRGWFGFQGNHLTDEILIKFKILCNYICLSFYLFQFDHNDILHIPWSLYCPVKFYLTSLIQTILMTFSCNKNLEDFACIILTPTPWCITKVKTRSRDKRKMHLLEINITLSTSINSSSSTSSFADIFTVSVIQWHMMICEPFGLAFHGIKSIIHGCPHCLWPENHDVTYWTMHASTGLFLLSNTNFSDVVFMVANIITITFITRMSWHEVIISEVFFFIFMVE